MLPDERDYTLRTSVWVAVACTATSRVLIARRAKQCRNPGLWNFFGGGVERSEPPEATARRELHEEAGIAAGPAELVPLTAATTGLKHNLLFGLVVHSEITPRLNRENDLSRWVGGHELDGHHLLHPPTRKFSAWVARWLDELRMRPHHAIRHPYPLPWQHRP